MNDIQIQFGNKRLFLNNNSQKFDRAKSTAGPNASDFEILAHYDQLAGLIQDDMGQRLENGQFWRLYETWRDESKKMIEMVDENIAGLFFMFSKEYIPIGCATLLAKFSGFFYGLFIVSASIWLTAIMSQEGTKLDKHLDFYKSLREDIYKKVGTAIRSKKDFDGFLREKLEQSIKIGDKKILGAEEYFYHRF